MYLHLVKVLEDNYPEMMKRLYVINGKIFKYCPISVADYFTFFRIIAHKNIKFTIYCRSRNIRENLKFANIRELVASRIQSSR